MDAVVSSMKDPLKSPPKYKGKLLVAKCYDDTLVFGEVVKRVEPKQTEPRWDKRGEGMHSYKSPKKDMVIWEPVQRTDKIDNILRRHGFKHPRYLTWGPEKPRYVDDYIITHRYGFNPTQLALVSLGEEESAMDVIWPENKRARVLALDQFS